MYHKKKLALFISHIYGEYQNNLCQGVIHKSAEYGYQVEVYASNDGEDLGNYGIGEETLLLVPNFGDFDGVIFASSTYSDIKIRNQVCELLKKQELPIVEICEYQPTFPALSLENNLTTGTLTEHLILAHGCRRLCFLGCRNELFFSDRRQKAFEDTLNRHSLCFDEQDIYLCNDTEEDFVNALNYFSENGTRKFDGVVCYNDRVAIGFWLAAHEMGYEIPKDFAIVGCDCLKEGQNIDPPLTTVTFPTYQLGTAACDFLVDLINGKSAKNRTVFAEPVYAGSCGCICHKDTPSFIYSRSLHKRIAILENSMFTSMRMSADFSHITDIDEGMDLLEQYVRAINDCKEFYLCLYANWDTLSSHVLELTGSSGENADTADDHSVLLKLALKDGKRLPECTFKKTSLLPEFLQKTSTASYIVSPLYFEDRAFGYLAFSFRDNQVNYDFKFVEWIMNITQFLENIRQVKHTRVLTEHLEDIYMKDVLTGLYNHHGFDHYKEKLLASAAEGDFIFAMLFDLDCLKVINDSFGHKEGDFALRGISQALRQAGSEGDIFARFSGDEFFCLLKGKNEQTAKDFILKVNSYLESYNRLSSKPYNISASGGYAFAPYTPDMQSADIDALFAEADKQMYTNKKSKVKEVLRE